MKTTPESAIVAELHAEMKSYLETSFSLDYHDSPHSDDESLKSISFPAGSDDLDPERQPGDLLIRCAALYSILREETDPLVVQIICWLPTILLQCAPVASLSRRESLMKEAIAIWRWLLAEIPLLHVVFPRFSQLVSPDPRAALRLAGDARAGPGDLPRVGLLARRARPLVPRRAAPRAAQVRLSLPLQHGLREAGPSVRPAADRVAALLRSGRDSGGPAGRDPAAGDAAADRAAAAQRGERRLAVRVVLPLRDDARAERRPPRAGHSAGLAVLRGADAAARPLRRGGVRAGGVLRDEHGGALQVPGAVAGLLPRGDERVRGAVLRPGSRDQQRVLQLAAERPVDRELLAGTAAVVPAERVELLPRVLRPAAVQREGVQGVLRESGDGGDQLDRLRVRRRERAVCGGRRRRLRGRRTATR